MTRAPRSTCRGNQAVLPRTSKKPPRHLQGAVLGDPTGRQRGVILQWASSEQQHLVLHQETLQSLDVGLKHTKSNGSG